MKAVYEYLARFPSGYQREQAHANLWAVFWVSEKNDWHLVMSRAFGKAKALDFDISEVVGGFKLQVCVHSDGREVLHEMQRTKYDQVSLSVAYDLPPLEMEAADVALAEAKRLLEEAYEKVKGDKSPQAEVTELSGIIPQLTSLMMKRLLRREQDTK